MAQGIPKYANLLSAATSNQLTAIQEDIQNDYVLAEIYFQTLNVVNIEQTPLLDVSIWQLFIAELPHPLCVKLG